VSATCCGVMVLPRIASCAAARTPSIDPSAERHLCRPQHAMKGSGHWRTTLQAEGRMRWRSWWDRLYLTDPADEPKPIRRTNPSRPI
jgi:hypothetical protein